jgi:hypothetical protein
MHVLCCPPAAAPSLPLPGSKGLASGSYEIIQFCLEPDAFFVREEGKKEFDPSKVLTRQTYTLDMVSGGRSMQPSRMHQLPQLDPGWLFVAACAALLSRHSMH